jgi:hypothetical protein
MRRTVWHREITVFKGSFPRALCRAPHEHFVAQNHEHFVAQAYMCCISDSLPVVGYAFAVDLWKARDLAGGC